MIYTAAPEEKRAVEHDVARDVTYALSNVVEQGTGSTVRTLDRPVAGKTGTKDVEDDIVSAWFVAYTPQISTAVMYVAGDDGNADLDDFARPGDTTFFGGTYPALTWADYMQTAVEDLPVEDFDEPAYVNRDSDDVGAGAHVDRTARRGADESEEPTRASDPSEAPTEEPSEEPSRGTQPGAGGRADRRPSSRTGADRVARAARRSAEAEPTATPTRSPTNSSSCRPIASSRRQPGRRRSASDGGPDELASARAVPGRAALLERPLRPGRQPATRRPVRPHGQPGGSWWNPARVAC